jgi:hypothetical protein
MKLRAILVSSVALGLLAAGDAAAQKLSLRIDKGLVTLDAQNVTVDEVLARWIDTTGLNVISKSGQGSDIPVSLQFEGVPEREALRMVLRDLSGYIMGERVDPLTGVVTIDRLMILPQSAASGPQGAVADTRPRRPFVPARAATALTLPSADVPVDETPVELAPAPAVVLTPDGSSRFTVGTADGLQTYRPTLAELDEQIKAMRPAPLPTPAATPGNPFGTSKGAATPGQMTPAPPPPPFEPPITNPNADPRALRQALIESQAEPEP